MYDYSKLHIKDIRQVNTIVHNPLLEFKQTFNKSTSEILEFPLIAKWENWDIKVFSHSFLEIRGSFHKFWNNGTNENDFCFNKAQETINYLCAKLLLDPNLVKVCNLEFGVNVCPAFPAKEIIEQVVCYGNSRSLRPYEGKKGFHYIEYKNRESYIKLYDKGAQYNVGNIIRFEIKAMTNRYLNFASIHTLNDLTRIQTMQTLGMKINQVLEKLIFKDDTIDIKALSKHDRNNYLLMKDPNEWALCKGNKSSTHRNREKRFTEIVHKYGKRNFQKHISKLVSEKVDYLIS